MNEIFQLTLSTNWEKKLLGKKRTLKSLAILHIPQNF